jgi:hypothetical protein
MSTKWKILIGLSILWLISTVFYPIALMKVPDTSSVTNELLEFLFRSVTVYGVLFSTLLTSFNSLETSSNITQRNEFDKNENSFRIIEKWDMPLLKEARDMTREMKAERESISNIELIKKINDNKDLKRSVITMFNYFDEIYLSIFYKRVNEESLKKCLRTTYIDIFNRFKAWLEKDCEKETMKDLEDLERMWK